MFEFGKRLPKRVIEQMKQNAVGIQKWYDNESYFTQTSCEMNGVNIPEYVLIWGDRILRTSRIPRDYRKFTKKACLIFWNTRPEDLLKCLKSITIPKCCIHCGVTKGLQIDASSIYSIKTTPDSAHYLNLSRSQTLSLYHCEACKKNWRSIHVRFAPLSGTPIKSDTRFLTFEIRGVGSKKAYRNLAENNSEHFIPFFEILSWKQVSKAKLYKAFH